MAKKKKSANKSYKAQDVFSNAYSFRSAATHLAMQGDADNVLVWPVMMNEAFALELFLKTLYRLKRRYGRSHDIKRLFDGLSKEDRAAIKKHFQEILNIPAVAAVLPNDIPLDIESVIERSQDMFVRGRYWHEGTLPSRDALGNASNAGVGVLIDAVRHRIFDIQPRWETTRVKFGFGGEKAAKR